jgi:hypothetical protein
MGDKKNLFPYVFDDLKYIYPSHRKNGEWIAVMDLAMFDLMHEKERNEQIKYFQTYVPTLNYEKYIQNRDNQNLRLVELPQDRTFVIRTHTTKRNQNLGISWGTTGLFDIIHKEKLKNMEKSVANKIINALAVLTIGSEKEKEYSSLKLSSPVKKKVHSGVKNALEKNESNGVTVIAIPEFAKLDFPNMKSEALNPDKFESINTDIQSSYGLSPAILNGTGSNFSSAKLNLEIMYKRIAVLLECIEREVYGKFLNLLLSRSEKDNYYIEYDKSAPISSDKRLDALLKLHSEGFAVKPIVDALEGITFSEFIEQSKYELSELKLQESIKPYSTSYTTANNGSEAGRNKLSDSELENENTIKTRTNDGNNVLET